MTNDFLLACGPAGWGFILTLLGPPIVAGALVLGVPIAMVCGACRFEKNRREELVAMQGAKICVHCGYDLRATPYRCPECGNLVARK